MRSLLSHILLLALALCQNSCVITRKMSGELSHKPWRMDNKATTEELAFKSTIESLAPSANHPVKLGYLEFDDQGELWRMGNQDGQPTQLGAVIRDIQRTGNDRPMKTIVYIHGWHNNASPRNEAKGNLRSFKRMLEAIGPHCGTPLYGVYVSWRGGTLDSRPVMVDVWDREATANRVGGPTMLAALRAITAASHKHKDSRVIMVGHSFGGKILTQVASEHLAGQIGRSLGSGDTSITPLADTVVVINSATNGPEMRQIHELMRAHKVTYQQEGRDLPVFITIASESDFAVRRLLPIYFRFNRDMVSFPERSGSTSSKTQEKGLYTAMGFNKRMIQYDFVSMEPGQPRPSYPTIQWDDHANAAALIQRNLRNGARGDVNGLVVTLQTDAQPDSLKDFRIQRTGSEDYRLPYWGFTVPDFVVSGHSSLWQPNFVGIIAAFEGMGRSRSAAKTTSPGPRPKMAVQNLVD